MHEGQDVDCLGADSIDKDTVRVDACLTGSRDPARSEEARMGGKLLRSLLENILQALSGLDVPVCDKSDNFAQVG